MPRPKYVPDGPVPVRHKRDRQLTYAELAREHVAAVVNDREGHSVALDHLACIEHSLVFGHAEEQHVRALLMLTLRRWKRAFARLAVLGEELDDHRPSLQVGRSDGSAPKRGTAPSRQGLSQQGARRGGGRRSAGGTANRQDGQEGEKGETRFHPRGSCNTSFMGTGPRFAECPNVANRFDFCARHSLAAS